MTFTGLGPQYLIGYFACLGMICCAVIATLAVRRRLRLIRSRKTWIANSLLSLLIVAALLLVFEGYFAFVYDTTDSWGLLNTTQLWIRRHAPHPNNLGARERGTVSLESSPDTFRIFFVGDSFTWGHGVARQEDRFSDLIGRELFRKSAASAIISPGLRRQFECHNVSFLGMGTADELEEVQQLLSDGYAMDMLILVYTMNDIADLVPECVEQIQRIYDHEAKCPIIRNTYFPNFLYYRWTIMRTAAYSDYYGDVRRAYDGVAWPKQTELLGQFVALCHDANVELRVVTFPFLHDLGEHYRLRDAHAKLSAFWEEHEVPHIDLLDVYSKHKPTELVVNRFDAHPNEYAHRLAADTIMQRWFGPR